MEKNFFEGIIMNYSAMEDGGNVHENMKGYFI